MGFQEPPEKLLQHELKCTFAQNLQNVEFLEIFSSKYIKKF